MCATRDKSRWTKEASHKRPHVGDGTNCKHHGIHSTNTLMCTCLQAFPCMTRSLTRPRGIKCCHMDDPLFWRQVNGHMWSYSRSLLSAAFLLLCAPRCSSLVFAALFCSSLPSAVLPASVLFSLCSPVLLSSSSSSLKLLLLFLILQLIASCPRVPQAAPHPLPHSSASSCSAVLLCLQILLCLRDLLFPTLPFSCSFLFASSAGLVRPTPPPSDETCNACSHLCKATRRLRLVCALRSRLL